MNDKKYTVYAVFVAMLVAIMGLTPAASGQGTVAFQPMTEAEFNAFVNHTTTQQVAWEIFWDIPGGGLVTMTTSVSTNYYPSSINMATSTEVQVIAHDGTITASSQIISGSFGSTGHSGSGQVNSTSSITGLVIGISNPYSLDGDTQIINNMFVGPNHWSTFIDTTGNSYLGGISMFSDTTTSLNISFTLDTPVGSMGQIYMFGLTEVPEPNTIAVIGIGLLMLVARTSARRK